MWRVEAMHPKIEKKIIFRSPWLLVLYPPHGHGFMVQLESQQAVV